MIYGAHALIRDNYIWVEIPSLNYSFQIHKNNSVVGGPEGEVEQNTLASIITALQLRHEQRNMVKGAGA